MTTQEALNIVYSAARLAPLNAETHERVVEAAKMLQEAITPKEEKKK
jgi:hypothetical protein